MASDPSSQTRLVLRLGRLLLAAVLLDLGFVAVAAAGHDSPLTMPDGAGYVVEAAAPLVAYGLTILWVVASPSRWTGPTFVVASVAGIVAGCLQAIHMILENVGSRVGERPIVTLAFMGGAFLVWGVGGYAAARRSRNVMAGPPAGCSGAMVSVLLAVTFGLILMAANQPPPAYVATWKEFAASGWTNARAFGIANSFDAVLSHLLVGPVIGTVVGACGALAWSVTRTSERGQGRAVGGRPE